MALAREQITIVDLHDGVDGSTYSLNILGGTRTISYNATGKSPTPAQTAYSCELYKDGVKVTPSSYAWSASGHLSGTSTDAGFTPTAVQTYNASLTSSNVVSLTVAYGGTVFKGTVQVVVTKAATDAKLITLVADSQVFKVVGKTVSPATAKITAETQNTSVTAWTYSSNGAAFASTLPDGVTRSGSTVTVTGASMTAQTIAVKASDGTYSDVMTIVKVADGGRGEPGEPAVQPITGFLTNESVTFPADFNGNVTGHTGPVGSFKVFRGTTDVTASASFTASNNVGGTVTISPTGVYSLNSLTEDRASVDLKAEYGGVSIVKTLTISKSRAGAPGPEGYTVILTNESHVFPGLESKAVPGSSVTSNIIVYKGPTQIASSAAVTGAPSGMTVTVAGKDSTSNRFTAAIHATEPMTTMNGELTVTVTADGKTFPKKFSFAVAKKGADGTPARVVKIIPSALDFVTNTVSSDPASYVYTPSSIALTPTFQSCTYSKWQYSTNGSAWTNITTQNGLSINSTSKVLTVPSSSTLFSTAQTFLIFKCLSSTGEADVVTLNRVFESGALGSRLRTAEINLSEQEGKIALKATQEEVNDIETRLSEAEVKVEPGSIVSTVRGSTEYIDDQGKKVSANEIISKINQSAEKIEIEASKINIKGKVTFESFDSSTAAEINSKARTFTSTPVPPYSLGDIWKNSTSTYMCKVARATGSYVAADWEKTGDVTSANKAADTSKVNGTAAATVVTGATAGSAAKTATDRWTYTGKTTIDGGKIQTDTVTAVQIKANTITAKEIEANTITVDELASSVGGSLDLSSNTAITSRVTSTELGTALNGKEDSLYKQTSAPAHKVGRLWLDTSVTPNALSRSTGSAWVKVTPTTAAEVGAYSSANGSALATRVSAAEQKILPGSIKSTVETQVTANGSTVLATKSDITQTERNWTAKFSSIGGANMLTNSSFSENLKNTGATSGVSIVLKDGRNSARINGSFGRTDTVSWSVLGKVEPNEKYTMSGWVKLENIKSGPTNYAIMYYADGNSNGTWYGWGSKTIPTNTSSWQYVTHTFTTPSASILNSATTCNVYLYTRDFTGTIYFRNLQLEKGGITTDWSPHPEELYSGITTIDKDGVTVGREGETIQTNLGFDGVRINDGATEIASFTGSGANIKNLKAESISGDVVNTLSDSVTLNVGKTAGYFATVEQALASTGNAKYLGLDVVLTINIYDILNEDVSIAGFTGAGKVVVNLHGRINGHLWTEGNSCLLEIYGKTTGNVIKGTGYPYLSRGDSGVHLDNIVVDAMNSEHSAGFMIREGSTATLRGADIVNTQDGIVVRDGAIAQITYARGNPTRYGVYSHSGVAFIRGTVPKSGSTAVIRAVGGFAYEDGTPTQENSRFSPPPTTTGPETRTFNQTDIYTYSVKYGARSTHYGKAAAQNRWDTSMTQMKGRIVFGSSVYSFISGRNSGTTPTVKIRLRRQNSTHGASASVKPTPEWSGAPSFGGATRGNWTAWATIPYTLFKSSGYEFSFYNESTGNSYAIWDRAEVQITRTITQ